MQDILVFIQQHWQLSALLVLVLLFLFGLELFKQKGNQLLISSARATQLINHQNAAIIDIRSVDAFAHGHIAGSFSIPSEELQNTPKKVEKLKQQPLILVSATGTEAHKNVEFLTKKGFTVHILDGGIRRWKMDQLPLVKH